MRHAQIIQRSHDNFVCAVASPTNCQYIASGQIGSPEFKNIAPILLWNPETCETIRTFEGLLGRVSHLHFAPDGENLVAIGKKRFNGK